MAICDDPEHCAEQVKARMNPFPNERDGKRAMDVHFSQDASLRVVGRDDLITGVSLDGWATMRFCILLPLLVYVCSGCMTRQYTVILRDGQQIAASNRPKVDKATAMYHFKDRAGRPVVVSAQSIREIEIR